MDNILIYVFIILNILVKRNFIVRFLRFLLRMFFLILLIILVLFILVIWDISSFGVNIFMYFIKEGYERFFKIIFNISNFYD